MLSSPLVGLFLVAAMVVLVAVVGYRLFVGARGAGQAAYLCPMCAREMRKVGKILESSEIRSAHFVCDRCHLGLDKNGHLVKE